MAFNLSRKAQPDEGNTKKPDQKKQMIVLLVIIALFSYLYFFTGLMRPQGEEKAAAPAEMAKSTMVKQPMPKRADGGTEEAKKEEATAKPAPVPPVPAKPATAVATPAAKPVPAPAQTKPAPAPAPAKATPPPAVAKAPAAKPATAPVPVKSQPPVKKAAPSTLPAKSPIAAQESTKPGTKFTLLVGEFPAGKLLNDVKTTIRKGGVAPVHTKHVKTNKQMHRLVAGEYAEHDQALADVQKLKKKGVDAFMGEKGDRYIVYAGSYLYADRAEVERDRLLKLGMNAEISRSDMTVNLVKVTAGTFNSQEKAQAAAEKLKAKGLITDVVELGK